MIYLFDPVSPVGHENFNRGILRVCLTLSSVGIFLCRTICPELHSSDALKTHRIRVNKKDNRWELFIAHYQFLKQAQAVPDPHLFLSFDSVSMLLACLFCRKRKEINIICHNNFRRAAHSRINRLSLKLLKFLNIKLVVLEEAFLPYVHQLGYKESQSSLLKYPLPQFQREEKPKQEFKKCVITYVSAAFEEKGYDIFLKAVDFYLRHLKTEDDQLEFKVLLGRKIDFNLLEVEEALLLNNKVTLISDFISSQEYLELLQVSSYICLPFRSDFSYSCSSVFFEALTLNKPLILSNIDLFSFYTQTYGALGEIFNSEDDQALAHIFKKVAHSSHCPNYSGLENMRQVYSDQAIRSEVKEILQLTDPA